MRLSLAIAALAVVVATPALANSGANPAAPAPPMRRTGAAVDGGLDCTACHRSFPVNSDNRGRIRLETGPYTPGQRQTIRLTIGHPEASRWGFQITARALNDETRSQGRFLTSEAVQVRCDDGQVRGVPAPPDGCGAQLEFASHTNAGTTGGGQGGFKTFELEWMPPANEVGDIVLYAAGNAADGIGSNVNDFIYTTSLRIAAQGACNQTRRPTLRAIANAAAPASGTGVAPNSLISLFGLDFALGGVRRTAGAGDFRDGRFPNELACVAVEIAGRRVPITFVQTDQINAQAPTTTQTGPVEVRVILNPGRPNELRSDVATVTMVDRNPAFFTFNGTSIAAQIAPEFTILADPSVVPGGRPARPGEVVILYATGFGLTQPVFQAGELAEGLTTLTSPVTVSIGGTVLPASDVLYAGLAPGSISGLYQFNVRVPMATTDGNVPVSIRIGSVSTQSGATIPVRRPN